MPRGSPAEGNLTLTCLPVGPHLRRPLRAAVSRGAVPAEERDGVGATRGQVGQAHVNERGVPAACSHAPVAWTGGHPHPPPSPPYSTSTLTDPITPPLPSPPLTSYILTPLLHLYHHPPTIPAIPSPTCSSLPSPT